MLSQYKYRLEPQLATLGKKLYWINPNALTLLGLVPPILFFMFMRSGNFYIAAGMLVLTSIDMLDGLVARANNKVTKFGGFLDSTLDRVSDFLIIAGLYAGGLARLEIVASLLLVAYLISYARLRAEAADTKGNSFSIGLMERGERTVFIFASVLLYALFPAAHMSHYKLSEILIALLALLCLITVVQRIRFAYLRLK